MTKTVKGISGEVWNKGLMASRRRDEPFGEWLGRAILRQAAVEAGDMIIPPERGPVMPEPSAAPLPPPPRTSAETVQLLALAVKALEGVPGAAPTARGVLKVLRQHTAALALVPPKPRQTGGQRLRLEGQTHVAGDGVDGV